MRALAASLVAIALFTVVLGFGYPALMTGFAAVTFHAKSTGSLIHRNGRVIGSALTAQAFTTPRYFHERPSATSPAYNAAGTTFSDLGPTSPALARLVRRNAQAILTLERPYNPGLTIRRVPVDAVVPSGSGVDPQISPAYAQLQARRVAAVRHLPLATVQKLIEQHTAGRVLGFFGEPGVNVLKLNVALDELGG
ncbi:MAG TPA: potassium-transporting ATPase subunit KdpC [Gaiellaceae bacterium]|jgi:K+-transporting ATPase ATPase C chain|nr:potassium-transporting ATPase subunit KdpC [Gaiellaceae bacterium]